MTFATMKLKEDSTSTAFSFQHMDNAIAKLCNMLLSNVYRIFIACFMVTLNLIKATMKSVEDRKQNMEDIESIGNDYISSGIGVKRERMQKKKYSSPLNDPSCTNNLWYARTKVNPGLLRARTHKNIQAVPLGSQLQMTMDPNTMNFVRAGNVDFPKHLRFVTCAGDNRNATTFKILSGTKNPHKCYLGNPFQNYTAGVSKLHDGVKTTDKTSGHKPKNVERASRKLYVIPRINGTLSKCNSLYGQRCLEVILELEE